MSTINGEKARANIAKRRRTQQRVKDAAARQSLSGTAQNEKPGGRPMAARAAKRGASGK
jgi:hypothetical protein